MHYSHNALFFLQFFLQVSYISTAFLSLHYVDIRDCWYTTMVHPLPPVFSKHLAIKAVYILIKMIVFQGFSKIIDPVKNIMFLLYR